MINWNFVDGLVMISICSSRGPLAFMFQMLFIQVTASLSLKSSCENPESFEREWELWYVYYIAIWYYASQMASRLLYFQCHNWQ